MGSSLTVTPAADIPKEVGKRGKLIIVNLQSTPLDKLAYMKINGLCDDVMKRLAAKLQLKVRDFVLQRLISFNINPKTNNLEFRGIDVRGVPFTFFKSVSFQKLNENKGKVVAGQPYKIPLNSIENSKIMISFYGYLG